MNFFFSFLAPAFLFSYFLPAFNEAVYFPNSPWMVENSSMMLAWIEEVVPVDAPDPLLLTWPSVETYLAILLIAGDVFWDLWWFLY